MSKNLPATREQRALPARKEDVQLAKVIGAFESESADALMRISNKDRSLTLYTTIGFLLLLLALSAVVKLDRVVTGTGFVVSASGQIYVSPLNAGIVKEIKVKVGDTVKKGQVLASLDPTLTQADVSQLQQKLDSDQATMERLQAEHDGNNYNPSTRNSFAEVQQAIFLQRQAQFRANVANFDAQIGNAQAIISQYSQDAAGYRKRLALASEVQDMYAPLVRKGYVSRQQFATAADSKEEMTRLLEQAENQITAQRQAAAAVQAQKQAYVQQWRADTSTQLVSVRDDFNTTKENLQKAEKLRDLTVLTSPSDAIVLNIGKASAGSVAQTTNVSSDPGSAGALFTLVPLDAPLEAVVNVSATDVGFIRPKDTVNIRFDAYDFIRHGVAEGQVKSVSEGSFTLDQNGSPTAPYFKVKVVITKTALKNVPPDFRLVPGMTLTGDVMVGSRTILSYLVAGAIRTGYEGMREAE